MIFTQKRASSAGRTTTFLVSRTMRLRAWWVQQDPYTLGGLAALLLVALISIAVQGVGPWLAGRAPEAIIIFATPQPTIGGLAKTGAQFAPLRSAAPTPTAAPAPTDEPSYAVLVAPAEILPTPIPQPTDPPPPEPPPAQWPEQTWPTPAATQAPIGPTVVVDGNELINTTGRDPNWRLTPTVPVQIVVTNPDGSTAWTYNCQPYGDWRDNDPMYQHPECRP